MREYGSVSPQFWIGGTGKDLRGKPECQVLALYLMTSPHANMIGVFHCPVMYMGYETGLGLEGASKALDSLVELGYCMYDHASETVFVVRMAAHQVGESLAASDNRVKGVLKEVEKIAVPALKAAFIAAYADHYHLKASPLKAPSKGSADTKQAPSKQLTGQEQEQEQEQEGDLGDPAALDASASPSSKQNPAEQQSDPVDLAPKGTQAGALCKRIRQEAKFTGVTPADPSLLTLMQAGYTDDEIVAVCVEAMSGPEPKGWRWVCAVVQARRRDAERIGKAPGAPPPDRGKKFAGAI